MYETLIDKGVVQKQGWPLTSSANGSEISLSASRLIIMGHLKDKKKCDLLAISYCY